VTTFVLGGMGLVSVAFFYFSVRLIPEDSLEH
jgi:hypothetical protein